MCGHDIGGAHDVMPDCMHIALFVPIFMFMSMPIDDMHVGSQGNISGLMTHLLDNTCQRQYIYYIIP
jgi:hypothetical protein